jgi:hypothetical protein
MAAEAIRNIEINKQSKYEKNFTQVDTEALGIAAGKLKLVGFRLYTYLIGNKNGYNFILSPLAYGKWYGNDYVNEDGSIIEGKRSGVNKALRDGIKNLIEEGYMIEVTPGNYKFYEGGGLLTEKIEENFLKNNSFSEKQFVPQETVCSFNGYVF